MEVAQGGSQVKSNLKESDRKASLGQPGLNTSDIFLNITEQAPEQTLPLEQALSVCGEWTGKSSSRLLRGARRGESRCGCGITGEAWEAEVTRLGGMQGGQCDFRSQPHRKGHLAVPSTDREPGGRRQRVDDKFGWVDIKLSTQHY